MTDNYFDKFKNLDPSFLENIWGDREKGLLIEDMNWSRTIRPQDVIYLLNRYPFLQILNTDPALNHEAEPKFITAKSGWIIHDYGDVLAASLGDQLFGNYGEDNADDGGESGSGGANLSKGKGTVVNQAFMTAQEMIALAIEKGWPGIQIVDGTLVMQWAAWVAAEEHQLKLEGYVPSKQDQKKRERIQSLLAKVASPTSKLDLKR